MYALAPAPVSSSDDASSSDPYHTRSRVGRGGGQLASGQVDCKQWDVGRTSPIVWSALGCCRSGWGTGCATDCDGDLGASCGTPFIERGGNTLRIQAFSHTAAPDDQRLPGFPRRSPIAKTGTGDAFQEVELLPQGAGTLYMTMVCAREDIINRKSQRPRPSR